MSKLSTQVSQLEMKFELLEHENKKLKAILYRLVTGDKCNPIEDIESYRFEPNYASENYSDKLHMLSVSLIQDVKEIATKEIS